MYALITTSQKYKSKEIFIVDTSWYGVGNKVLYVGYDFSVWDLPIYRYMLTDDKVNFVEAKYLGRNLHFEVGKYQFDIFKEKYLNIVLQVI